MTAVRAAARGSAPVRVATYVTRRITSGRVASRSPSRVCRCCQWAYSRRSRYAETACGAVGGVSPWRWASTAARAAMCTARTCAYPDWSRPVGASHTELSSTLRAVAKYRAAVPYNSPRSWSAPSGGSVMSSASTLRSPSSRSATAGHQNPAERASSSTRSTNGTCVATVCRSVSRASRCEAGHRSA